MTKAVYLWKTLHDRGYSLDQIDQYGSKLSGLDSQAKEQKATELLLELGANPQEAEGLELERKVGLC